MPSKRKSDNGASPSRKQPRLQDGTNVAVIEVDSDGDLHLAVKSRPADEPAIFLVDRKILCLSSPVFKAMLGRHSRFLEGQATSSGSIPKVTLEDDSIKAMGIVLHAVHLQGHLVPEMVSPVLLRHLAIVCDKYDLRKSLGSWPETWARGHIKSLESPCNASLLVACAFQLDLIFTKVTRSLILNTSTADRGATLRLPGGEKIGDRVPDVVLGKIASARMETILDIETRLFHLQSFLEDPKQACRLGGGEELPGSKHRTGVDICHLLQLGIFKQQVPNLEHPHAESAFRKNSICDILQQTDIELPGMGISFLPSYRESHGGCRAYRRAYNIVQDCTNRVRGLEFERSWNFHHGNYPATS